jgi:hypothetical protein
LFSFKLFLQRSFFRLIMLVAFLCFVGVFVYAVHLENNNVPPEGLRVPFADVGAPIVKGGIDSAPANSLSIQHMNANEVAMRLEEIIAEALSFTREDYKANSQGMQKYFTPEGYAQYMEFLNNSGFEKALAGGNLQSGAYTEEPPIELTHGVYNDVYKWVFEVPVTVSFIPPQAETYRNDETKPQNRRFLLRAQFARVVDPQDPDSIKIEIWQILPPRK